MQEIDVIRATRRFLQRRGLLGAPALDLFTDARPSLLGAADLRAFQRFTLAFDGFAVHPDLVCRLADGESLVAVEAKGGADLLRGIAQAELYRRGFHLAPLNGFRQCGLPHVSSLALSSASLTGYRREPRAASAGHG